MSEAPFTRNFQFHSYRDAVYKFTQLIPHKKLFISLTLNYCHIQGLPDYVVSVGLEYSNIDKFIEKGLDKYE